jgi:phospholipase/carboxylesterase
MAKTTRALQTERREPLSNETRSCVVLLHGYGAHGRDLIGLADVLAEHMPDTLFLSPDAPEACIGAPFGLSGSRSPGSTAPRRRWRDRGR